MNELEEKSRFDIYKTQPFEKTKRQKTSGNVNLGKNIRKVQVYGK